MPPVVELTDLDRRIWQDELAPFVPARIYDVHTHCYTWAHHLDPNKHESPYAAFLGERYQTAPWSALDVVDAALMPGRSVERLAFPYPFKPPIDFAAANDWLAEQLPPHSPSAGLMLVHPETTRYEADAGLRGGFVGFKPYRFYSRTGDVVNCGILDFLPEHLIALAHEHGSILMMHLGKRDAIADLDNRATLRRLCRDYPRAKWILAHCARSYAAWPIEAAADDLRGLGNVWYDVSSVCDPSAMIALIRAVGVDRVMYGSDDIPVGVARGIYLTFGRAWAYLSPANHRLDLSHCDERMTFVRYEQLRAMRRAAEGLKLSRSQIEALFHDTAAALVADARR